MWSCGGGDFACAHQPARRRLVQRVHDKRGFAAAGHAGDAGEGAERKAGADVFQVVAARVHDAEDAILLHRAAHPGLRCAGARQIIAGQRLGIRRDLRRGAFRDHVAAVDAGGRTHVDQMVGRADRVLIMFHNKNGVAEVAQPAQRDQQAFVVALVQADRRFVEHVQHAGEAGADLAGQADALALAARQRGGAARQGQIVQPDIDQELQALADLAEDAPRDLLRAAASACDHARRTTPSAARIEARMPRRCSCRRP